MTDGFSIHSVVYMSVRVWPLLVHYTEYMFMFEEFTHGSDVAMYPTQ